MTRWGMIEEHVGVQRMECGLTWESLTGDKGLN